MDPASIGTDVLQSVSIPDTVVQGSFFIGASVVNPGGFAAPMDTNGTLAHQSWGCYSTTGTFDPDNLGPTLFNNDVAGFPANWMLRADIQFVFANDCNSNQIPDECDIGPAWGGYCVRPPGDPDGPCDSDWNHDGIPDSCQMCGDINGDLVVGINDYYLFLDAFGFCATDPVPPTNKYDVRCDMDGDGCITLADYRAWRLCYKMANGGADFTLPKVKGVKTPVSLGQGALR